MTNPCFYGSGLVEVWAHWCLCGIVLNSQEQSLSGFIQRWTHSRKPKSSRAQAENTPTQTGVRKEKREADREKRRRTRKLVIHLTWSSVKLIIPCSKIRKRQVLPHLRENKTKTTWGLPLCDPLTYLLLCLKDKNRNKEKITINHIPHVWRLKVQLNFRCSSHSSL